MTIMNEIDQYRKELYRQKMELEENIKYVNSVFIGLHYVSIDEIHSMGDIIDFNITDAYKLECFQWCYDEDIIFRVTRIPKYSGTTGPRNLNLNPGYHSWEIVQFKNEADATAFKLMWCGEPPKKDWDDEIPF